MKVIYTAFLTCLLLFTSAMAKADPELTLLPPAAYEQTGGQPLVFTAGSPISIPLRLRNTGTDAVDVSTDPVNVTVGGVYDENYNVIGSRVPAWEEVCGEALATNGARRFPLGPGDQTEVVLRSDWHYNMNLDGQDRIDSRQYAIPTTRFDQTRNNGRGAVVTCFHLIPEEYVTNSLVVIIRLKYHFFDTNRPDSEREMSAGESVEIKVRIVPQTG
jgi:hypothetical protein